MEGIIFFIGFILVMFSSLLWMVCGDFCYYRRHVTSKANSKYELEGREEMMRLSFVLFILGVIFLAYGLVG
jgi:hypothetical protein